MLQFKLKVRESELEGEVQATIAWQADVDLSRTKLESTSHFVVAKRVLSERCTDRPTIYIVDGDGVLYN